MKIIRAGKKNLAVLAASAVVGALGIGGVVSAQADTGQPSDSQTQVEQSDGDGEVPDSQEAEQGDGDGEVPDSQEAGEDGETDDGPDVGPDADPNEPGHQDATD